MVNGVFGAPEKTGDGPFDDRQRPKKKPKIAVSLWMGKDAINPPLQTLPHSKRVCHEQRQPSIRSMGVSCHDLDRILFEPTLNALVRRAPILNRPTEVLHDRNLVDQTTHDLNRTLNNDVGGTGDHTGLPGLDDGRNKTAKNPDTEQGIVIYLQLSNSVQILQLLRILNHINS